MVRVRFLERPNRYLARVRSTDGGAVVEAHVPNPGRMEELLVPDSTDGYIVPASGPQRRTRFDLVVVRHGRTLVSIDSRVGNRIAAAALAAGRLPAVGKGTWVPEYSWSGRRLDFAVPGGRPGHPTALLEVKCSNLRVGHTALFPDAPTERGVRHLETLTRAAKQGIRATILFVIQRSDAHEFAPNAALDPAFARALWTARENGVHIRATDLRVRPDRVAWGHSLRVRFDALDQRLL